MVQPEGDHEIVDGDKDGERYIQRDSLIKVHCKHGEIISIENYRVLGFFTKYQNKWFVSREVMAKDTHRGCLLLHISPPYCIIPTVRFMM